MWVVSGICALAAFVWQDVFDGSEGEHDEAERGVGGVEAVGAVDDEPNPPVEAFVAGVVDSQAHRGQDAGTALANGPGCGDERFEAGALRLGAEPVEKLAHFVFGEVAGEDGSQGLLSLNRPWWSVFPVAG